MSEETQELINEIQELIDEAQTGKQHTVSESADKIVVKTKVKRGTGTRDEDKLSVKVKGNDPVEVVEKVNETISRLHNTAEDLRNMQPEEDE